MLLERVKHNSPLKSGAFHLGHGGLSSQRLEQILRLWGDSIQTPELRHRRRTCRTKNRHTRRRVGRPFRPVRQAHGRQAQGFQQSQPDYVERHGIPSCHSITPQLHNSITLPLHYPTGVRSHKLRKSGTGAPDATPEAALPARSHNSRDSPGRRWKKASLAVQSVAGSGCSQ